jgi:hypothetical protein
MEESWACGVEASTLETPGSFGTSGGDDFHFPDFAPDCRFTVAFLVPRDRMEALLETMEILANPEAMRAIRRDQSGKGKYLPLSVLDEA